MGRSAVFGKEGLACLLNSPGKPIVKVNPKNTSNDDSASDSLKNCNTSSPLRLPMIQSKSQYPPYKRKTKGQYLLNFNYSLHQSKARALDALPSLSNSSKLSFNSKKEADFSPSRDDSKTLTTKRQSPTGTLSFFSKLREKKEAIIQAY